MAEPHVPTIPRAPFRPRGRKVSAALAIDAGVLQDRLEQALVAVDGVHGYGDDEDLVHEIGHFLDHQVLGGGISFSFASATQPQMDDWRRVVQTSGAVRNLARLRVRKGAGIDRKSIGYWLRWHELWARSYAQYIALRGAAPTMIQQVHDLLERQRQSTIRYTVQWEPDDFRPIAAALDTLFLRLGWLENAANEQEPGTTAADATG